MTPVENSTNYTIYNAVIDKMTDLDVYEDRVYTKPLGWTRFIDRENCANKFYMNSSDGEVLENGQVVFDFDLDQEDDPELEEAQSLYCICHFEDHIEVFEVNREYGNGIRIMLENNLPTIQVIGHGNCEIKRSFVLSLDT
jgi:hypothetical protein